MSKIDIPPISAQFASTAALNARLEQIENELNDKVLYRVNPESEPNQMENHLDMNQFSFLNLGESADGSSPITRDEGDERYVEHTEVVDDFESESSTVPLSAGKGRELDLRITSVGERVTDLEEEGGLTEAEGDARYVEHTEVVDNYNSSSTTVPISAARGKDLDARIRTLDPATSIVTEERFQTTTPSGGVLDLTAEEVSVWIVNLTEDVTSITLPTVSGSQAATVLILFVQDVIGGHAVSGWPPIFWEEGDTPEIDPVANTATSIPLVVTEDEVYGVDREITLNNLSTAYTASTVEVENAAGSNAVINGASSTDAGVMTTTDYDRLYGIEAGAEVNDPNAITALDFQSVSSNATEITLEAEATDGNGITSESWTIGPATAISEGDAADSAGVMTSADREKLGGIDAQIQTDITNFFDTNFNSYADPRFDTNFDAKINEPDQGLVDLIDSRVNPDADLGNVARYVEGTSDGVTDFPVGSILFVVNEGSGDPIPFSEQITLWENNRSGEYTNKESSSNGTQLVGVWRCRGNYGPNFFVAQRTPE